MVHLLCCTLRHQRSGTKPRQDQTASSTAQTGVKPTGLKPYCVNSILMVVMAVMISTVVGALNGYVLTKWRNRGDTSVFGLMLFSCFIPFQIVPIPVTMALGTLGMAGISPRSGPCQYRLRDPFHHAVLSQLLCLFPDRSDPRGTD